MLTSAEGVAEHCDVHPETIRRLARAGRIPVHRVGRAMRFDVDEVRAALRVDTTASHSSPTPAPDFDALDRGNAS